MEELNKNIIEELDKSGLIYLFLGSLISSEKLLSIKDCENSLKQMIILDNSLKVSNIDNDKKIKYKDFIDRGIEIIKRDLENIQE
jgi:hypothetical protein